MNPVIANSTLGTAWRDGGANWRACLFDLDGVLTKTADLHAAAWKSTFDPLLASHGSLDPFDPIEEYLRYVDGKPRADGVRDFLASRGIVLSEGLVQDPPGLRSVAGLGAAKDALFRASLAHGVTCIDGAVECVLALRSHGVRCAVVSASENTHAVLRAAGITDLFDVCVDGVVLRERGLSGKPAPDSFIEAARMLGVAPGECVVVEDARAGVEAGRAGGFAMVVGVDRTGHGAALLDAGADLVVRDLWELTALWEAAGAWLDSGGPIDRL